MTVTDPTPTPTEPTTPATPAAQPAKPVDKSTEDAPTLTQKQFDEVLGRRLKESTLSAAKKLGFETVEEMEAAALETQDAKKKNQTELEREKDLRVKAEKERDEAKQQALASETKRRADYVDSRMTAIATAAKAIDAAEVAEHLRSKRAEEIDALYSEDGKFNEDKATKLIEEVKKSKGHWFKAASGVGSPSVSGGRPLQPDADMNRRATEALRRQIRNS